MMYSSIVNSVVSWLLIGIVSLGGLFDGIALSLYNDILTDKQVHLQGTFELVYDGEVSNRRYNDFLKSQGIEHRIRTYNSPVNRVNLDYDLKINLEKQNMHLKIDYLINEVDGQLQLILVNNALYTDANTISGVMQLIYNMYSYETDLEDFMDTLRIYEEAINNALKSNNAQYIKLIDIPENALDFDLDLMDLESHTEILNKLLAGFQSDNIIIEESEFTINLSADQIIPEIENIYSIIKQNILSNKQYFYELYIDHNNNHYYYYDPITYEEFSSDIERTFADIDERLLMLKSGEDSNHITIFALDHAEGSNFYHSFIKMDNKYSGEFAYTELYNNSLISNAAGNYTINTKDIIEIEDLRDNSISLYDIEF